MTWTTAAKEKPTEKYKDLSECSFISRGFKRMRGTDLVCGPLNEDSVYDLPLWTKGKTDAERRSVTCQNVDAALREWFLHGREKFDTWKYRLNKVLIDNGCPACTLTYDKLLLDYASNL